MNQAASNPSSMLSLRVSRWRQPRLTWLAVVLVAVVCLGFGVVAHAMHPELCVTPISLFGGIER